MILLRAFIVGLVWGVIAVAIAIIPGAILQLVLGLILSGAYLFMTSQQKNSFDPWLITNGIVIGLWVIIGLISFSSGFKRTHNILHERENDAKLKQHQRNLESQRVENQRQILTAAEQKRTQFIKTYNHDVILMRRIDGLVYGEYDFDNDSLLISSTPSSIIHGQIKIPRDKDINEEKIGILFKAVYKNGLTYGFEAIDPRWQGSYSDSNQLDSNKKNRFNFELVAGTLHIGKDYEFEFLQYAHTTAEEYIENRIYISRMIRSTAHVALKGFEPDTYSPGMYVDALFKAIPV